MIRKPLNQDSIPFRCAVVIVCVMLVNSCTNGDDLSGQSAAIVDIDLPGPVTFSREVAPIIWDNCAICHRPGSLAPFSLLTYEEVSNHAQDIALAVEDRHMPPWLPEVGYGSFLGDRRLSDKELETILRWVSEGAPSKVTQLT